jgi:hypothetical protein
MAYSSIVKPTDYFNTVLYSGNATARSITGVGFQPDWVWIKGRTTAYNNTLFDSVRGATKRIYSNGTDAESTQTATLTSFDSDGFSLGNNASVNSATSTFVVWNWLGANGTASNSDGSITSTVSANTTAGFSIVSYTGTGSNATVGHGLGVAPKMIILKKYDVTGSWGVYHHSLGNSNHLYLQNTDASTSSSTIFNSTSPTSSVFSIGANAISNGSSNTHIAYCFAEKKGYSKFGSYTGNGSTAGTFVYTGFRPAWVLIKNSGTSNTSWTLYDNKRLNGFNSDNAYLLPSSTDTELSDKDIDLLSNGFKPLLNNSAVNTSGDSYIYMAFAENPFVANDSGTAVPVVAR